MVVLLYSKPFTVILMYRSLVQSSKQSSGMLKLQNFISNLSKFPEQIMEHHFVRCSLVVSSHAPSNDALSELQKVLVLGLLVFSRPYLSNGRSIVMVVVCLSVRP